MFLFVTVVVGLAAASWLTGRLVTPRSPTGAVATDPPVSVIVPARNEAATLPTLLDSLQRLDVSPHEVIVVDDDSDDDTAQIAAQRGAMVVSTSPPPGWLGKPWACHAGAGAATGTHLLFLDSDTWLAPSALGSLTAEHAARGGMISVQPYHATTAPYEELSAYFNAVAMMGTGAFAVAGGASSSAFGPCLLTSAADYGATGGHAAVRSEVIEDIRLAQRYRAAALPVTCFAGGDLVRFRMYPGGLRQLVDGWSKNIASGAGAASPIAVVGAVLWVASHAAVVAAVVIGLLGWARGTASLPFGPLIAWVVVAAHLRWVLRRIGSFRWVTALAFPVPLAVFVAVFARSVVLTSIRREVTWRGRRIRLHTGKTR